jgi:hypothetical protein
MQNRIDKTKITWAKDWQGPFQIPEKLSFSNGKVLALNIFQLERKDCCYSLVDNEMPLLYVTLLWPVLLHLPLSYVTVGKSLFLCSSEDFGTRF